LSRKSTVIGDRSRRLHEISGLTTQQMQRLFRIPDQGDNKKDLEITINEMTIFELEA
jgi:hypothetical protein